MGRGQGAIGQGSHQAWRRKFRAGRAQLGWEGWGVLREGQEEGGVDGGKERGKRYSLTPCFSAIM